MTCQEFLQSLKSQQTPEGVRIDHDFEAGKRFALDNGGNVVSERRDLNNKLIVTIDVRCDDGTVFMKWDRGLIVQRGVQLPDYWHAWRV